MSRAIREAGKWGSGAKKQDENGLNGGEKGAVSNPEPNEGNAKAISGAKMERTAPRSPLTVPRRLCNESKMA